MMFGFRVWWEVWCRRLFSSMDRFIEGMVNVMGWDMMRSMDGRMRMDWVMDVMRSMVWCRMR